MYVRRIIIQISVLNVEKSTPPGKKYVIAEVSYKNLTFNKVESKKIFSFGAQEQAFKALADAKAGDVFDVEVVKNAQGYNDWTRAVQAPPGASPSANTPAATQAPSGQFAKPAWQGESAEERARKQVMIVKQSSLANAIAALSVGAKAPVEPEKLLLTAQAFTDWVLSSTASPESRSAATLGAMIDTPNDIEVE